MESNGRIAARCLACLAIACVVGVGCEKPVDPCFYEKQRMEKLRQDILRNPNPSQEAELRHLERLVSEMGCR